MVWKRERPTRTDGATELMASEIRPVWFENQLWFPFPCRKKKKHPIDPLRPCLRKHATKNSPACLSRQTGQHAEKNPGEASSKEKTRSLSSPSASKHHPHTSQPSRRNTAAHKHSSLTKDVLIGLLLQGRRHRTMPQTTTSDADSSVSLASFTITSSQRRLSTPCTWERSASTAM